ncbi:S26 family signal peptidase [Asticcacaulis sp. AC466]|uniref:S26 family signal peptidase n=1 Tax=Asticcacaulis sp. AC466 TaxID=1282362 RepID=UPI00190F8FA3|nr:S26 family signal peptidase [Asticcacaulis sp. AC466]
MIMRWQPARQTSRDRKRGRVALALTLIAGSLIALSVHQKVPAVVYNPSASAPLGYYRTLPATPLKWGDWVLVEAPDFARRLADSRGYLPANVPMIKAVAALAGDRICADGNRITINGTVAAVRLRIDHRGRPLPWWTGCRTLTNGEIFVLNRAAPSSFDGRYFGPMSRQSVLARLVHL